MFSLPQLDAVQIAGLVVLAASAAYAAWQRGWLKLPAFSPAGNDDAVAESHDVRSQMDWNAIATNQVLGAVFTVAKYAEQQKRADLQQAAADLAKRVLEPKVAEPKQESK